jgi:hypothetical protein
VIDSHDALIDLLEPMESFLKRLDIYTRIPPTPAMDELVAKIIVEVISTLALATKELKWGRRSESRPFSPMWSLTQCDAEKLVKTLFGGKKDAEAALQRLDRLTQDAARVAATEILPGMYCLVQDRSE